MQGLLISFAWRTFQSPVVTSDTIQAEAYCFVWTLRPSRCCCVFQINMHRIRLPLGYSFLSHLYFYIHLRSSGPGEIEFLTGEGEQRKKRRQQKYWALILVETWKHSFTKEEMVGRYVCNHSLHRFLEGKKFAWESKLYSYFCRWKKNGVLQRSEMFGLVSWEHGLLPWKTIVL